MAHLSHYLLTRGKSRPFREDMELAKQRNTLNTLYREFILTDLTFLFKFSIASILPSSQSLLVLLGDVPYLN